MTVNKYILEKADIGMTGLAVMGENLILNMEGHGYTGRAG